MNETHSFTFRCDVELSMEFALHDKRTSFSEGYSTHRGDYVIPCVHSVFMYLWPYSTIRTYWLCNK